MRALRERERRGLRRLTIGVSEDDLRVIAGAATKAPQAPTRMSGRKPSTSSSPTYSPRSAGVTSLRPATPFHVTTIATPFQSSGKVRPHAAASPSKSCQRHLSAAAHADVAHRCILDHEQAELADDAVDRHEGCPGRTLKFKATITFSAAERNINPDQTNPKMAAMSGTTSRATAADTDSSILV